MSATIELPAGSVLLAPVAYERGSGCTGATTLVCALDFLPNGWSTPLRLRLAPGAGTLAVSVATTSGEPDLSDNRAAVEVVAPRCRLAPSRRRERGRRRAPGRLRAQLQDGRRTVALTWTRKP